MTTFSAPLQDVGHVEIYDHSRFVSTTFNYVKVPRSTGCATPGEVLEEIVDRVG